MANRGGQPSAPGSVVDQEVTMQDAPAPTQTVGKFIRASPPDTFDGTRGKLRTFLSQVELCFFLEPRQFSTHQKRVLYSITFLRGAAFDWANVFLRDFLDNMDRTERRNETNEVMESWIKFKERLQQTFGDIDEERTAERRLQSLRQTGSAADYAAQFQRYGTQTEWDDAALTAQFYKGLKDHVKDDIARGDRPDDLETF